MGCAMRWMLIPICLLGMASPLYAAKRLTVAQLEQTLAADAAAHRTDEEIALKIGGIELSERLTERTLGEMSAQFTKGSPAMAALLLLADRSAFLEPPRNEQVAKAAPDAAMQQQLLQAAQRFAIETLPSLPNLLATRTTFSFDDSPQEVTKGAYPVRVGMHLIGTSKAEVSAQDEKENASISSKPAQAQGGLSTWGEFGSTLLIILRDSARGKTSWSHWEETSSGLMAVFHYQVPKAASHYEIDTPTEEIQSNGESIRWAGARAADAPSVSSWKRMIRSKPAYEGSLWIDPATGTITRLTLIADLKGNPTFDLGEILVDYGPVHIADKTLICPLRSLALSAAPATVDATLKGYATEWLNENLFTGYHLFGSTSRILAGNAAASAITPKAGAGTAQAAASEVAEQGSSPMDSAVESEGSAAKENGKQTAPTVSEGAAKLPGDAQPSAAGERVEPRPAAEASTAVPASAAPSAAATIVQPSAGNPTLPMEPLQPAAPAENVPTIRVHVNELVVPVVVRDRQDHAIGNLTANDFTVLDQGKRRPITGFTVLRSRSGENAEPASEVPAGSAGPTATGQKRFVVFLFDDRHLDSSDLARVQQAANEALSRPLAPNEYAAVVSMMGVNSGITRDPAVLKAAVMKLAVHRGFVHDPHDCSSIDYFTADKILNKRDEITFHATVVKIAFCHAIPVSPPGMPTTVDTIDNSNTLAERLTLQAATRALERGNEDARESLNSVETVVRAISKLQGQRVLIVVSPGFPSQSPENMLFKSELLDQAAASDVVISTLDARGLYSSFIGASQEDLNPDHFATMQETENSLSEMAAGTGGTYFHNNNDLAAGLESLMAPPETLYLLDVSLNGAKPSGTYHQLRVKVDRKGASVQARRGYFAAKEAGDKR